MPAPVVDNFKKAVDRILAATTAQDLFGGVQDSKEKYRGLSLLVHPDTAPETHKILATAAFAKLSKLWDEFNGKIDPITIKTKRGEHPLGDLIASGHIANVYASGPNVIKMPRSPSDNDLMEREVKALKMLDSKADPQFRVFAPRLVETFRHKDDAGVVRRVNVLERLEGFVTLDQVKNVYPNGLDPRDLAWIWRRLFVAVGLAADNGLVHGAVTPDNIMVHPVDHGVVLMDWVLAADTSTGQKIPAIDPAWPDLTHADIAAKETPTHRIDITMLAKTMLWMIDGRDPKAPKFRAFARGCMATSPPSAAQLLAEFDDLLAETYGKRRYRKLEMPQACV